ncbi:DUF4249 domain-containing protein [Fulvivirga ulvae]|uniref:DUF4249 domain-containing protein n=1 Tax=Fulvivirga ulvae TaxID=2904245 RepID=UPI001F3BD015|nr:DUF4249 domain-containing protein [Fulvivirga ulvae]UII29600.1 DUF4249 domain-containing protein [Fulvivirga ulvae]
MKSIVAIIIAVAMLSSCEKEISIDLNSSDSQVVIDGSITDTPGPYYVRITRSVNFNDANDYPPITDAMVIISDDQGTTDTLTEASAGVYQTSKIVGTPGNTYFLSIAALQKNYFATSTMPLKVNLDSLKFEPLSTPGGEDFYSVLPIFKDPATSGNNYRFLLTINGEAEDSYLVDNDIIGNGLVNKRPIFSPDAEIESGDTVKVEMRCIDLAAYTYFYTLSQITDGGPGGGTTPSNPPNNITGDDALGVFSAYTTQALTQKVQ